MENKAEEKTGFAVDPKKDCPHFKPEYKDALMNTFMKFKGDLVNQKCVDCENMGENWICLECQEIFCSRFVKSHMVSHNEKTKHPISFSFSDASFWCYSCDSYITSKEMLQLSKTFSSIKFDMNNLVLMLDELKIEKPSFDRKTFIDGLKNKKFKKIIFLTGAGMSVTAGIPDFRSKGTGLYEQLANFHLPQPESIFDIDYFRKHPKPFYILSKAFLDDKVHFTINHFFIAEVYRQGMLLMNFSQNIDGLDKKAGLPDDKLVEAHGHYRSAHCIKCGAEHNIQTFYDMVKKDDIFICNKNDCDGNVKPDIVFFGEQLPEKFFMNAHLVSNADLVIIMGTSLKVFPFASMVDLIPDKVPLVCINRSNPGIDRQDNFLFIEGTMDDSIEKIMDECGWKYPKIERIIPNTEYIKNLPLEKDKEKKPQEESKDNSSKKKQKEQKKEKSEKKKEQQQKDVSKTEQHEYDSKVKEDKTQEQKAKK